MRSFKQSVNRVYAWAYSIRKLGGKELSGPRLLPITKRVRCWAHGFFSASHVLYDLDHNPWGSYVSDLGENLRAYRINGRNRWFLENKILFWTLVSPHAVTPTPVALISEGAVLQIGGETRFDGMTSFLRWIAEVGDVFVKPYEGASGCGVHRVRHESGGWELDGHRVDPATIEGLLGSLDGYLVTGSVTAGLYSRKLFEPTANTVRILTMTDPDTGEPFIAAAAHRIGTAASAPVDNCAAGGLTAAIDIETGRLGRAVSTKVVGRRLEWFDHHPDSRSPIAGVQVPEWEDVKALALRLAQLMRFCPYVGWDLLVTDEGIVVLEGNDGPDLKLHQVHGPLLADPRVRRFYEFHRVVGR